MGHAVVDDQRLRELGKWRAWDKFIESKTTTGFMQSSWWADFMVAHGCGRFGTVIRDGQNIVGGAVVLTRSFTPDKCYYYIDEGPVLLEEESSAEQEQVFQRIMEFIDRNRQNEQQVVSHLRINPRWKYLPTFVRGFKKSRHFSGVPRDTQCIDLSASETAILAQMKPKGRYNIGVARRYGVSVLQDVSPEGIEDFLNIHGETFARKNLGAYNADYIRELITMLSTAGRGSVFFCGVSRYETRNSTCGVLWPNGNIFLWWLTCDQSQCDGAIPVTFRDHVQGKKSRLSVL
jgi:lipid II:glycine glycyltransferase (peptidoglycan interpeptide bridge formation enzyme)